MTSWCLFDLHGRCRMVRGFGVGFCTKRVYLPYLWFAGSLNLEVKLTGRPISFSQCICGIVGCDGRGDTPSASKVAMVGSEIGKFHT